MDKLNDYESLVNEDAEVVEKKEYSEERLLNQEKNLRKKENVLPMLSLIFGVASFGLMGLLLLKFYFFIDIGFQNYLGTTILFWGPPLLGIIAVILGSVGLKHNRERSIMGIVFGAFGFYYSVLVIIFLFILGSAILSRGMF